MQGRHGLFHQHSVPSERDSHGPAFIAGISFPLSATTSVCPGSNEANWGLKPLSPRSRDNLPNPIVDSRGDPYLPLNRPAIGDLMNLFDFHQSGNRGDEDEHDG
jgi:hypothetical protein